MFSIGMSQSRCAIFQARHPAAGNEYPGLSCADDAPSDTDSAQNARCCKFCRVAITPHARGPGSGGPQRAASLQGFTAKANSSSERRFEDVGAGCVDGSAALVTDLMFSIGMSQSRCAIFQARHPAAGNEYPGLSCADDAPSDTDSAQNARCCKFCRVAITPRARGPGSGGPQRAASLQGFTAKANSSSERRFEDVGAGCVDGRRCASNRFDVFHWNESVPLHGVPGKALRCRQRVSWSQLRG